MKMGPLEYRSGNPFNDISTCSTTVTTKYNTEKEVIYSVIQTLHANELVIQQLKELTKTSLVN